MTPTKTNVSREEIEKARQSAKEPVSELDIRFAKMTRRIYQNPIWSGKKVPPVAWRILSWMMDRTSSNEERETEINGRLWPVVYGTVDYGKVVSFKTIGTELNCCWRTVQTGVEWLCDVAGFVKRYRRGKGKEYRYEVVASNRTFKAGTRKALEVNTTVSGKIAGYWRAWLIDNRCPEKGCGLSMDKCQCGNGCFTECGEEFDTFAPFLEHVKSYHAAYYANVLKAIDTKDEIEFDVEEPDYEPTDEVPAEAYP